MGGRNAPTAWLTRATAVNRPTTGLRNRATRGVMINAAFTIGLLTLGLVRGFVLAIFLAATEYGVWGILVVALGTLSWLRNFGIADKYIQQDDEDQEVAFQRAFTLEMAAQGAFLVLYLAAIPLVVLIYGEPRLALPALVLGAALPAAALQAPLWVFYRQMDFMRQRVLMAIDPIVGLVTSLVLAVAGAGEWALVLGFVAGTWSAAFAAIRISPYRLRLRRDAKIKLKEYGAFSWPILVAGLCGVLIAQLSMLVGEWQLGLAGAGALTLAATVINYTNHVNKILMQSLYPALCAAKDRTEVLFESFVKSNRLAVMWEVPFGIGLLLFAPDLIEFVLGEKWSGASGVLQGFGAAAALGSIGANWGAFYMARGETRPQAVEKVWMLLAFLAIPVPLLIAEGLTAFGYGMAAQGAIGLVVRGIYLRRLFSGFRMVPHLLRGWIPTIPAVGAVLVVRMIEQPDRTASVAIGELVAYLAVTIAVTWVAERQLLSEAVGYLRGKREQVQTAPWAEPHGTASA